MLEGLGLGRIVQHLLTGGTVEAVDAEDQIVLIQLVELTQIAPDSQALAVLDKAVQGLGALAAGGDRVDRKLRAGVDVAADKDVVLLGLVGNGIGNGVALLAGLQRADIELAPVDGLADGGDDGIDLDGLEKPYITYFPCRMYPVVRFLSTILFLSCAKCRDRNRRSRGVS